MYELLTNTVVYNVSDIDDLADKMDNYSIKRPTRLNPHIPDRLEDIMLRALEVKPGKSLSNGQGNALRFRTLYVRRSLWTNQRKTGAISRSLVPVGEPRSRHRYSATKRLGKRFVCIFSAVHEYFMTTVDPIGRKREDKLLKKEDAYGFINGRLLRRSDSHFNHLNHICDCLATPFF